MLESRERRRSDKGSPPIYYSWLRGDESSGGNLTTTGVHMETWTLHDARHGDAFACEVNNKVGGANTTMERSDIVTVRDHLDGEGVTYASLDDHALNPSHAAQSSRGHLGPGSRDPSHVIYASLQGDGGGYSGDDGDIVAYAALDQWALNRRGPGPTPHAGHGGAGRGADGDSNRVEYARVVVGATDRRGRGGRNGHNGQV
ncbi:unnamed protein product [Lampetra fluviatilis]